MRPDPALPNTRYSTEDVYWGVAALPENDERRLELDDGEIVDVGESRPINSVLAARIGRYMSNFVDASDLGIVTSADCGFRLSNGVIRVPDVAFVPKHRWFSRLPDRFKFPPDLAVEVVSESEDEDILRKTLQYLDAGTRAVWTIYPEARIGIIFTLSSDKNLHGQRCDYDGVLTGGDILPDFSVSMADLFKGL